MSNVVSFPNDREIADVAGLWISQLDRGLSEHECRELSRWIAADRRHRDTLFEMAALWDRMDLLGELSLLFPLEKPRKPRIFRVQRRFAPATMALLVSLVTLTSWMLIHRFGSRVFDASYKVEKGQQRTLDLSDGSVVMLNTATTARVHLDSSVRLVELIKGEAHFQVAREINRAFIVRAGANDFRAVGTAFDVRLAPEGGAALTVTEGRVQVLVSPGAVDRAQHAPATTEIMVDAGKEVVIGLTTQTVKRLSPTQVEAATAWQHGMILLEHQPLEDALREVTRYSNVQFRIEQEQIRHLPVSGYFRVGDIEALVLSLRTNFNIEATRSGDLIDLRAREE